MLEPIVLSCGHTYGKSCVEKVKTLASNPQCPDCRSRIYSTDKFERNIALQKLIFRLPAECNLCAMQFELGVGLKHHLNCVETDVECKNEECTETMKRKDLAAHEQQCQFKEGRCEQCNQRVVLCTKNNHEENQCPKRLVDCPLGCAIQIRR